MKDVFTILMARCTALLAMVAFLSISGTATAQMEDGSYDFPSDTSALPYSVSEVVTLIQEAYESPVETNAYVQMIESYGNFPQLSLGALLTKGQKQKLTLWVAEHPAAIEDLLIARKRNYDTYFNPATKGSSK